MPQFLKPPPEPGPELSVSWPFSHTISSENAKLTLLLGFFWQASNMATRRQLHELSEQLTKNKNEQPAPPASTATANQPQPDGYRKATRVTLVADEQRRAGECTTCTDDAYKIELWPMANSDNTRQTVDKEFGKPVGDKLYQPTPLTVGALADKLYTVYQAEITHLITMDRVEKNNFTTQGYDIMDELETKIASAISLYGQGESAKHVSDVKRDAYPKSPSPW